MHVSSWLMCHLKSTRVAYFGHVFPDGSWQTLSAIFDSMYSSALLAHAWGFLVSGFQLQRNPLWERRLHRICAGVPFLTICLAWPLGKNHRCTQHRCCMATGDSTVLCEVWQASQAAFPRLFAAGSNDCLRTLDVVHQQCCCLELDPCSTVL